MLQALLKKTRPRQHGVFRLDVDLCSSARAARYFLLRRLADFQTPTLVSRNDLGIGDVAFVDLQTGAFLFARGNLVVLVRNAGNEFVELTEIARDIDRHLTRNPETEHIEFEEMSRFSIPKSAFSVGDRVPLHLQPHEGRGHPPSYKFFSPLGCVRLSKGKFIYEPACSGQHQLTVFEFSAAGSIGRQQLSIEVTKESSSL